MSEPKCPFQVRAKAAYPARTKIEITLIQYNTYTVISTDGKGLWWQAHDPVVGNTGWFPASFVDVIAAADVLPAPPPVTPLPTPAVAKPQPMPAKPLPHHKPQPVPHKPTPVKTTPVVEKPIPKATPVAEKPKEPQAPVKKIREVPTNKPPPPDREKKEKGLEHAKVTLKIQVMQTNIENCKKVPTLFVLRQTVFDSNKFTEVHKVAPPKRTSMPLNWNELFHMIVNDAEEEKIIIRFCNVGKLIGGSKELVGEICFSLRGAVRDFDSPYFQNKEYPIVKDGKEVGTSQIYIEFTDTRVYKGPHNFKHAIHLGYDPATGKFDSKSVPAAWKTVFASVGIKPGHLKNPDMAERILSIMEGCDLEGGTEAVVEALGGTAPAKMTGGPPTPKMTGGPPTPTGGPSAPKMTGGPPAPKMTGGPPAPKMGGPPAPKMGGPPAPKMGAAPKPSGGGGGGMDLAAQLAAKRETLANAGARELGDVPAAGGGNTLENALTKALFDMRPAVAGADEDGDDWSDDEEWSD